MANPKSIPEIQQFLETLNLTEPPNEPALKILLKDICVKQKESPAEDFSCLHPVLEKQLLSLNKNLSENSLLNLLQHFKVISEDASHKVCPLLVPPETVVTFSEVIFPEVTSAISKSSFCDNVSSQRSSSLLHKSVRISLNIVKALEDKSGLEKFGLNFLSLVNAHPMAILDVKCNAGLVICHLSSSSFVDKCLETIAKGKPGVNVEFSSEFEKEVWGFLRADYVNRVSLCFGSFGTRMEFSRDFMTHVANTVLLQRETNSTKEAVNLGSGRVLEIWMDKVLKFPDLSALGPILPLMEIFIFTYLAGHIDAVKNCCRNMLCNLSVVYSRLDNIDGFSEESLLKDLLVKILAKPFHVKWAALAAATRNNPETAILTQLWKEPAESLLCSERTFKNAATEVYLSLMKYTFEPSSAWKETWLSPLLKTQESQNNESNWSQKKSILTKAMSSDHSGMQKCILNTVITAVNSGQDLQTESWLLIVECLKIGTELGVELEEGLQKKESDKFRGVLPRTIFNSWTYHSNPQIRLASLSLLIDTRKTTEVFSADDFHTLRSLFKYNLVSQNPAFRQQFMSYFKRLMRRLKDGRSFCKRLRRAEDLANYDRFVEWLWLFFTREGLFPGANFSRRCQSLLSLVELLDNFPASSFMKVMRPEEALGFLSWLGDSYENNKIAAVEVLSQLEIPQFKDSTFVNETLNTALGLLTSVKPPESVTGRYLLLLLLQSSSLYPWNVLRTLLTQLEQIHYNLQRGAKTLLEISSTTPPYGLLRAIRLLMETYKSSIISEASTQSKNPTRPLKSGSYPLNFNILQEYATRLLKVCLKLDDFLFPVLGDAAPEGFLPDLNENADIVPENSKIVRSINAQMLLVSSWRSMKEICILLTELCINFPLEGEESEGGKNYIFTFAQVKSIGEHLLSLLLNLMHRGVFEQVFVGFKNLCVRLKKSKARRIQNLSKEWLEDVMRKVTDKCTTRRSAGLPFVFQAILTPEVGNEAVMTYWMEKLLEPEESLKEIMAVRIHSMNVLRALFRDANFARAIMEWVPAGIKLAFHALRAKDWAEQNSGLMLYGSVIRRTFGPRLNLMSAPTFFRRFPEMYDFLLEEVRTTAALVNQSGANGRSAPSQKENDLAYHLLLLFSCFSTAPGKLEEGNFRLSAFIPNIQACGASPDIQVRTMAAKALVPFITSPEDRQKVLENSLDSLIFFSKRIRSNKLHGDLLQLIAIISLIKGNEEEISAKLQEKFQLILDIPKNTNCPLIFETFANLSICLNGIGQDQKSLQSTARTLQKINEDAFLSSGLKSSAGLADARGTVALSRVHFSDLSPNFILSSDPLTLQQLLEYLLEKNRILPSESNVALARTYLGIKFPFPGQTDAEISFLSYFTVEEVRFCGLEEELLERMLQLCEAEFGRVEVKEKALRIAGKIFASEFVPSDLTSRPRFASLMFEWTDARYDDELRIAVAKALPSIPIGSDRFSPKDFSKLWTSVLTLALDDEFEIRGQIFRKLGSKTPVSCFKALELVLAAFFSEIDKYYTSPGLWTLLAFLLKDDYEVVATVADDEDEDRLFGRSEMNMFAEKATVTKIVLEFLEEHPEVLQVLKSNLNTQISSEDLNLFLEFSSLELNLEATQGLLAKEVLESILTQVSKEGEEKASLEELFRGHEKATVQDFIRGRILKILI